MRYITYIEMGNNPTCDSMLITEESDKRNPHNSSLGSPLKVMKPSLLSFRIGLKLNYLPVTLFMMVHQSNHNLTQYLIQIPVSCCLIFSVADWTCWCCVYS